MATFRHQSEIVRASTDQAQLFLRRGDLGGRILGNMFQVALPGLQADDFQLNSVLFLQAVTNVLLWIR